MPVILITARRRSADAFSICRQRPILAPALAFGLRRGGFILDKIHPNYTAYPVTEYQLPTTANLSTRGMVCGSGGYEYQVCSWCSGVLGVSINPVWV